MFGADEVDGLILVVLKTLDKVSLWPVLQSLGDLERICFASDTNAGLPLLPIFPFRWVRGEFPKTNG